MRRPTGGDPNRKSLNLHHGILVSDAFMSSRNGRSVDLKESKKWNCPVNCYSKKFVDKIVNS